tara:strand:+ start:435 stop:695 length:261 start_codon:yes stop_codon:yes gene_type:complete
MKKRRIDTKLKLMSIITERISDFVCSEDEDTFFGYGEERVEEKLTQKELQERVEEININEEVGFIKIKEMRRIIKQLIKKGIDEEY